MPFSGDCGSGEAQEAQEAEEAESGDFWVFHDSFVSFVDYGSDWDSVAIPDAIAHFRFVKQFLRPSLIARGFCKIPQMTQQKHNGLHRKARMEDAHLSAWLVAQ